MKKMLCLMFLLIMLTGMVSANSWGVLKAGYGNETGGIGGALEGKWDHFGIVGGVGMFNGEVTGGCSLKYYFNGDSADDLWLSVGAGVVGYEYTYSYSYTSGSSSSSNLVYGFYSMFGYSSLTDFGLYWDGAIGGGVGEALGETQFFLTMQASIGIGGGL